MSSSELSRVNESSALPARAPPAAEPAATAPPRALLASNVLNNAPRDLWHAYVCVRVYRKCFLATFLSAMSSALRFSQRPNRCITWFGSLRDLSLRALCPCMAYRSRFHKCMSTALSKTQRRVATYRKGWNKISRLTTSCIAYLLSGDELNAPSESESSELELAFPDPLPSESSSDAAFGLNSAGVIQNYQEQQHFSVFSARLLCR